MGILNGKNSARIILGVISVINILGGLSSVINGDLFSLLNIGFNLIVLLYILLNKKVKKHFSKKAKAKDQKK